MKVEVSTFSIYFKLNRYSGHHSMNDLYKHIESGVYEDRDYQTYLTTNLTGSGWDSNTGDCGAGP